MSGSPVYIDGRLIGAVSYALGSFSKEPIAGITPIAEMTDATALSDAAAAGARASSVEFPLTRENLTAAFRKALNWNRPFADRPDDAQLVGVERGRRPRRRRARHAAAADRHAARHVRLRARRRRHARRRVPRPGLHPDRRQRAGGRARRDAVRRAAQAGRRDRRRCSSAATSSSARTGTVTHIDGDRVYAFGHPMYNLGPTEFPMTRAYVYTVLPSLFSSIKLSTTGDVIGTFLQDRATAIAGTLGAGAAA